MTIDIEKLAIEAGFGEALLTWPNVPEKLLALCEAYAAKVLEDKEREIEHWKMIASDQKILIEGLKGECKDMGTTDICIALARKDTANKELKAINRELSASINKLREASQALIDRWNTPKWKDAEHTGVFIAKLEQAISKTPAQSLQAFENEVIEKCAETAYTFLDDPYLSGHGYATGCSDAILELKGNQND